MHQMVTEKHEKAKNKSEYRQFSCLEQVKKITTSSINLQNENHLHFLK